MKKHPATWLLALIVALGAGQAVPLSSLRQSLETCIIMKVIKVRRKQQVPRERAPRAYVIRHVQAFPRVDFPTVIHFSWNAPLLRGPPLSLI